MPLLSALSSRLQNGDPLLPLRIHGFIRAVPGLWACLNPACSDKPDGDWLFGAILHEQAESCPHCAGAVLEIISCVECGESYLDAIERDGRLRSKSGADREDEFAAASEVEAAAADDAFETDVATEASTDDTEGGRPDIRRIVALRSWPGGRPLHVEPSSGIVCDGATETTCMLSAHDWPKPEFCPACRATARPGDRQGSILRPFRYGAPFLIGNAAPVLLDGVVPQKTDPTVTVRPPAGGRQLLSFTDSRQGTARFAAALQNASERNAVRALVYHAVQDSLRAPAADPHQARELDAEILKLEPLAAQLPQIAEMLEDKRKKRAALEQPHLGGIRWAEMRDILVAHPDVERWMREIWRSRDQRFDRSASDFAEFLLLRELARRPRRANALEPLGLARLRFGAVDGLGEGSLPQAFRNRGRTLVDWRAFLNLLITVNIRTQFAVRIDPANQHWLIRQGFPRILVGPGGKKQSARELTWPQARPVGRPAIAVRLLERGLKLDAGIAEQRAEINETLEAAWQALSPILARPGTGANYALDFADAHIAPVVQAYSCPVTPRLLDTVFLSMSPYGMDGTSRLAGQPCERLDLPRHPNPFLLPERGGAEVVEAWLAGDEIIAALRARRHWGDLHDRIALGSPYVRAAEHSAQQPPARLRRYEEAFKDGRINILNCSTTMEMGVDIGSVSTVMMTNVPPSIANYRQRVGRAGRRGQGLSTALTYCRDTALDREAFRNPAKYLVRGIEAPKVTLDSRRIVQRHINALLLAAWFREVQGQALKTTAGDFFGCPPAIPGSRAEDPPVARFRDWVARPSTTQTQSTAIATLVRGSSLEGQSDAYIEAGNLMQEAETAFVTEWEAIQAQTTGLDRDAARKALGMQLKRMCGEYLLGELADRGVLPGHGFPTSVVPFIHADEPDAHAAVSDDGSRSHRRGYPTRNLDLAIRDYAPGAEVVVDGLVYRSAGVTLNWKRPAAADAVGEVQSLKWFWACRSCGTADTTHLRPASCVSCGSNLEPGDTRRFLQPSGFTVDSREQPHADIDQIAYVEPEPERVVARNASWRPFLSPTRGRLRTSHDGLVFYASAGESGAGYSVCLECGRAEAQTGSIDPNAKRPLHDHRPLRYTKADADGLCPGNGRSFAVQTDLALGHDIITDVTEIQPAAMTSQGAAWALASALREALVQRLGIDSGEIGLSVVRRPTAVGGTTHSLNFYDRASGGAGFSPRLTEMFEDLLRRARDILDCPAKCVAACSACVLSRDLHAQADVLDRVQALAFVDTELAAISEPEDADRADIGSRLARDVADELVERTDRGARDIFLWPAAPFDPAALLQPRMKALLNRMRDGGHTSTLCIESNDLNALDDAQRLGLRDAAIQYDLRLATGAAPRFRNDARAIAGLSSGTLWASRDDAAAQVGEAWGVGVNAPVVSFSATIPSVQGYDRDQLLPRSETAFIEVNSLLDGPSRNLADRFSSLIRPHLEAIGRWRPGELTALTYTDRYVHSPLVALLVVRIVRRLAGLLAGARAKPKFRLTTAPLRQQDGFPNRLQHDWRSEADRDAVLHQLCGDGLDLDLTVGACGHSRRLTLTYGDGSQAAIVLDQGFGFLKVVGPPRFEFQEKAVSQARRLAALDFSCVSEGSTYIVVVGSSSSR